MSKHGKGKGNVWKGYYQQGGQNHPMIFRKLKIKNNLIEGKGKDDIAKFKVRGMIEHNGNVRFKKEYKKKHTVEYYGHYNPQGQIAGQWNLSGQTGTFYINQDFNDSSSSSSDSD